MIQNLTHSIKISIKMKSYATQLDKAKHRKNPLEIPSASGVMVVNTSEGIITLKFKWRIKDGTYM